MFPPTTKEPKILTLAQACSKRVEEILRKAGRVITNSNTGKRKTPQVSTKHKYRQNN